MKTTTCNNEIEFLEKWGRVIEEFDKRGGDGRAIAESLDYLYAAYSDGLPTWLAGLYDKEVGGFYYSNSARDNDGFLPDIESTVQALNFMRSSGMVSSVRELPEEMKKGVERFVKGLQSADDGFIYHPQWGKDITDSRRGRDMMWACVAAENFGFSLPYPTANERLKSNLNNGNKEMNEMPEHFGSKEAMIKYLDELDWVNNSYYAGNMIAAQAQQIMAAGLADTVVEYVNQYQNPENGFWYKDVDMHYGINGFMKITSLYIKAGAPIPRAELAAESAMSLLLTDEIGTTVCHLYNVWVSLTAILYSLRKSKSAEDAAAAERIAKKLLKIAPIAIRNSRTKSSVFQKEDGSFSYMRENSCWRSQGAPVSLQNMNEGDVNASCISSTGIISNIYSALDAGSFKVPLYTKKDYTAFISAMKLD
ncbi:MAG: hypothetical protein J6B48_01640 [Clostridia bacterium]|nr:hypothetical protein [Clostridia bacterium]